MLLHARRPYYGVCNMLSSGVAINGSVALDTARPSLDVVRISLL
jgi:hypothetical protein